MDKVTFITQAIQRLKSESPKFFKGIQWVMGIALVLIWATNAVISKHFFGIDLPEVQRVINWLNSLGGTALGGLVISLLTTTDAKLMDDKTKTNVITNVIQNNPEIVQDAQIDNLLNQPNTGEK